MRVKICGITREECGVGAGAGRMRSVLSFIPTVLVPLPLSRLRLIRGAVSGLGMMVGLFVDPSAEEVEAVLEAVPLNLLQFHGRNPRLSAVSLAGPI